MTEKKTTKTEKQAEKKPVELKDKELDGAQGARGSLGLFQTGSTNTGIGNDV